MILILSNSGDFSTDVVMDWLRFYDAPFIKINSLDLLNSGFKISITNENSPVLTVNNKIVKINDIKAVWYRKFGFFQASDNYINLSKILKSGSLFHINGEFSRILRHIEFLFKDCFWLTNPDSTPLNKLNVLLMALKCGFKIPNTYIINNKQSLSTLIDDKPFISKSVYDPSIMNLSNTAYMMYTTEIMPSDMKFLPDTFLPSLIQEKIEKDFEIRTFYLEGECYSMAIMSQSDKQTELDFRKYNWKHPNRFVPLKLSIEVENNIDLLMKELGLNTGSLDFIQMKDGSLCFLEINPTGQFGMVEYSCNYNLHELVAQTLIKNDKQ